MYFNFCCLQVMCSNFLSFYCVQSSAYKYSDLRLKLNFELCVFTRNFKINSDVNFAQNVSDFYVLMRTYSEIIYQLQFPSAPLIF